MKKKTIIKICIYNDGYVFIGADETYLRKMYGCDYGALKDGECIVVENVTTEEGKGFEVGLDVGTEIQYNYFNEENEPVSGKLTVADHIDKLKINIPNTNYMIYVLVNMNTFNLLKEYRYPQILYFNDLKNKPELIHEFFKGIKSVNVVNIHEEIEKANDSKRRIGIGVYVFSGLFIFLLSVNTIVCLMDRYDASRRKMAMLKAMGIANSKIIFMQLYDYIRMLLTAILVGLLGTRLISGLLYDKLRDVLYYFSYKYPWKEFLIPLVAVVGIFVLSLIPFMIKIRKMNINESLQGNR